MLRRGLIWCLLGLVLPLVAATMVCSQCGKTVAGRYLTSGGKVYCSTACYNRTLPKCAICGKPCTGTSYVKNNRYYCSETCVNQTLPRCKGCGKPFAEGVQVGNDPGLVFCRQCAARPTCFSCQLPAECRKLEDGRNLCKVCERTAVFQLSEARQVFEEVRRRMADELGLKTDHRITFFLIGFPEMEKRSPRFSPGNELGLYSHNYTERTETESSPFGLGKGKTRVFKTDERYSVYALYGLSRQRLIEVCAHELAHDWMAANYPKIKDLKIQEGWAEYVATQVNRLFGNADLNRRMEQNTDPVYGEGYRMIADYVKGHGLSGLKDYFSRLNR